MSDLYSLLLKAKNIAKANAIKSLLVILFALKISLISD